MNSPWIRAKDIPDYYSLSRWKGYELARLFKAQADRCDVVKDGKILLVKKEPFEEWWRQRGEKKNG